MSQAKNLHEAERWYRTAAEDLNAAQALRDAELYAHACFQAQQCAEKAIKALWYLLDLDPWGHSIQRLVRDFPNTKFLQNMDAWEQRAAYLDRFYIPTRYPNGLPDLTPGQSFHRQDADQAIEVATSFLTASSKILLT